eukprot:457004_1
MPCVRSLCINESSYRNKNKKRGSIIKLGKNLNVRRVTESTKTNQMEHLAYFIQVTSILSMDETYEFRVVIKRNKTSNTGLILYIKEMYQNCNEPCIERVSFKKNEMKREIDIEIKPEHDALYHLALYTNKGAHNPLPNSNQLRFEVLKHEERFPEIDGKYKPKCIDLSTVVKCKDTENNMLNIYWSVPTKSFGEISYRCIDDATKRETTINELPYCISLSEFPISFKVITVATDERGAIEDIFESEPSKSIVYNIQ